MLKICQSFSSDYSLSFAFKRIWKIKFKRLGIIERARDGRSLPINPSGPTIPPFDFFLGIENFLFKKSSSNMRKICTAKFWNSSIVTLLIPIFSLLFHSKLMQTSVTDEIKGSDQPRKQIRLLNLSRWLWRNLPNRLRYIIQSTLVPYRIPYDRFFSKGTPKTSWSGIRHTINSARFS